MKVRQVLAALSWLTTELLASGSKEFLLVAVPMSPIHGVIAIGQELCLRGHNVTVLSFGERGESKVKKYSPTCKLRYISLGPLPVSDDDESQAMSMMGSTNSTWEQLGIVTKLLGPYSTSLKEPVAAILESGSVRPDFALLGFPFGAVASVLDTYSIDYAVNLPTILMPPVAPWVASYVPVPFYHVSPYNMTFFDRLVVIGGNSLIQIVRCGMWALGSRFSLLPELNPEAWRGHLLLVNSIPGVDYPMSLPPLVQYTGPVVDVQKMETFPAEVESWLDRVPENEPVVYVSFGTMVRLAPERVAATVATLTSQHFHVLWALPKPQQKGLPDHLPPNMMVHHWIPTPRTLAHPKVLAFISHCGGNSAAESMALGIPLIGYPQFGDQPAVCQRIQDAGAGITRPAGSWVQGDDVLKVLRNPTYSMRAQSVSRLFKNFGGVSKAADLLELAAQGDLDVMRTPPERSMRDWFSLSGYDLLLLLLMAVHVAGFFLCHYCRCCYRGRLVKPAGNKKNQ
eukprot:TRINITY_DN76405_c0_g1_i1.p1 TRINITY_DN76405_c0_g1~~TRINITY_DN76405_c0_g1_i1.p1  ORF type:complete len:531 (+),score=66.08 TRINITY_DN76405_c0_g1_i1:61-1593(+)